MNGDVPGNYPATIRVTKLDDAVDQQFPRPGVTGGWYAPAATVYDQHDVPGLPMVNHPCKLLYDAKTVQQKEGPHSMYSNEAIQQASYTLQQEREAREAAEIIDRIKAFGEDVYADATVLRFSRQFFKNRAKTQLHDPAVFSALRYTDEAGNTTWSDDTGTKRTWDELVAWFVTHGKPITLDDVEIFPPAGFIPETVFPAANEDTTK